MLYEMTGTVKMVKELQTFPSGFSKREFVVTTEDERYPQDIAISCIQDRISMLDSVSEGQRLKVTFSIRGREWQDRHFVDLQAYKIESLDGETGAPEEEVPFEEADDGAFDEDFIAPF